MCIPSRSTRLRGETSTSEQTLNGPPRTLWLSGPRIPRLLFAESSTQLLSRHVDYLGHQEHLEILITPVTGGWCASRSKLSPMSLGTWMREHEVLAAAIFVAAA